MSKATSQRPAYALVIGVGDYSTYDATTGHPRGHSDLPASVNDALTHRRLADRLGIPPGHVHLLVSPTAPVTDAAELAGLGHVGAATGAAIRDHLAWLVGALTEHPTAEGLVTFSGHGDVLDGYPAIVPTDARGVLADGKPHHVEGAIPLSELASLVAERPGVRDRLTVLLEASFAAVPKGTHGVRGTLTGRALAEGATVPAVGDGLILASAPGAGVQSYILGPVELGAATWALDTATARHASHGHGGTEDGGLARRVLHRAQALLDAAGIPQHLRVGDEMAHLASPVASLLGRLGTNVLAGGLPPGQIIPFQVRPDLDYALFTVTLNYQYKGTTKPPVTGTVVSVGTTSPNFPTTTYQKGREYWDISAILTVLDDSSNKPTSVTFSADTVKNWGTKDPFTNLTLVNVAPSSVSWQQDNGTQPTTNWTYDNANGGLNPAGICMARGAGGQGTAVYWRLLAASTPATGAYAVVAAGRSFGLTTAPVIQGQSWYIPV